MSEEDTRFDEKLDKIYDLLEKVYLELKNTKTELRDEFKKEIHSAKFELKDEFKYDLQTVKSELRDEFNYGLQSLKHELQSDISEFRQEVNTRFDKLENFVQQHDVEIKTIKAAK